LTRIGAKLPLNPFAFSCRRCGTSNFRNSIVAKDGAAHLLYRGDRKEKVFRSGKLGPPGFVSYLIGGGFNSHPGCAESETAFFSASRCASEFDDPWTSDFGCCSSLSDSVLVVVWGSCIPG